MGVFPWSKPLGAILAILPIAACQSSAESDPVIAAMEARAAQVRAPSSQRLDSGGYPLLGAYPSAAAPQLTDAEVQAQRGDLQQAVGAQNALPAASDYDSDIAALQAASAAQRDDAPAAGGVASEAELLRQARERMQERLRAIEGS